ncbi:CHRD domain-containing protein [Dokdonella sp.]|uniref:CHRD domain-containing protein n=1 Tax=Dokdonella sp. TaxID=2291710 RepID=UPI003262EF24
MSSIAALCLLACTSRADAQVIYTAILSGAAEVPPNSTTGTGSATITYFPETSMMIVSMNFTGLASGTTSAHIHCCTMNAGAENTAVATGVPSFAGFPAGVTAGTYANTFDMSLASNYNPSFVTSSGSVAAALGRLLEGMGNGTAYIDIHTIPFPGGEIRGNLVEQPIFRSGFE